MAGVATETVFGGVPVLALVAHLALVYAYGFAAGVAVLGEHGVEAVEAVWTSFSHYVSLSAQLTLAFGTGKMLHVPCAAFCFRTFIGKDDLVTSRTSGFDGLGMMTSAVQSSLFVEIDQIYQKLVTDVAGEASRMPAGIWSCT